MQIDRQHYSKKIIPTILTTSFFYVLSAKCDRMSKVYFFPLLEIKSNGANLGELGKIWDIKSVLTIGYHVSITIILRETRDHSPSPRVSSQQSSQLKVLKLLLPLQPCIILPVCVFFCFLFFFSILYCLLVCLRYFVACSWKKNGKVKCLLKGNYGVSPKHFENRRRRTSIAAQRKDEVDVQIAAIKNEGILCLHEKYRCSSPLIMVMRFFW